MNRQFHSLSTRDTALRVKRAQSYPQGYLRNYVRAVTIVPALKWAKRPGVLPPKPLLIHPLERTNGGTLPKSNQTRATVARQHLELLRKEHDKLDNQDRTYVTLAFTYGLTVPEIAEASGLTFERIRYVLGGA